MPFPSNTCTNINEPSPVSVGSVGPRAKCLITFQSLHEGSMGENTNRFVSILHWIHMARFIYQTSWGTYSTALRLSCWCRGTSNRDDEDALINSIENTPLLNRISFSIAFAFSASLCRSKALFPSSSWEFWVSTSGASRFRTSAQNILGLCRAYNEYFGNVSLQPTQIRKLRLRIHLLI